MKVNPQYIKKYWHLIVRDQIIDEYKNNGYEIITDKKFGNIFPDLYVEKEGRGIIIEFTGTKLSQEDFSWLHKYARENNLEFRVIVANYSPLKNKIEVDDIEFLLSDFLINYRPESIPDPAHHSTIDYISDVDISEIYLGENNIYIKGSSICNTIVSLDNEGDTDINFDFPMTFNLEMGYENRKLKIMDTGETEIEIDDNSFYS